MDLYTFTEELEKEIRKQEQDILEIDREVIRKNNGVCLDAMILRGENRSIAPAIYPQQLFSLYQQGMSIEALARQAAGSFREAFTNPVRELDGFFDDYDRFCDKIYCRLVNRGKNLLLLDELLSEEWMDLAVTYYCRMRTEGRGCGAIQIRRGFPEDWGVDEKRIREDAWRNTMRDYPPFLQPLYQAMQELGGSAPEPAYDTRLFVLSNREKFLGAVSIACPGETEHLAAELGGSFYVIPSSIHECLVLPDDSVHDPEELGEILRSVNSAVVDPQEVLADHVYRDDAEEKRLREG